MQIAKALDQHHWYTNTISVHQTYTVWVKYCTEVEQLCKQHTGYCCILGPALTAIAELGQRAQPEGTQPSENLSIQVQHLTTCLHSCNRVDDRGIDVDDDGHKNCVCICSRLDGLQEP